jgi:hypothetical protein
LNYIFSFDLIFLILYNSFYLVELSLKIRFILLFYSFADFKSIHFSLLHESFLLFCFSFIFFREISKSILCFFLLVSLSLFLLFPKNGTFLILLFRDSRISFLIHAAPYSIVILRYLSFFISFPFFLFLSFSVVSCF